MRQAAHPKGDCRWSRIHDLVADSQGNIYTAEISLGSRPQKFAFQGLAPVTAPVSIR